MGVVDELDEEELPVLMLLAAGAALVLLLLPPLKNAVKYCLSVFDWLIAASIATNSFCNVA